MSLGDDPLKSWSLSTGPLSTGALSAGALSTGALSTSTPTAAARTRRAAPARLAGALVVGAALACAACGGPAPATSTCPECCGGVDAPLVSDVRVHRFVGGAHDGGRDLLHVEDATASIQALAAGDVDADGRGDLVFAGHGFTSLEVVLDAAGAARRVRSPDVLSRGEAPRRLRLVDTDGDGDLDVVAERAGGPVVLEVLAGDGAGRFEVVQTLERRSEAPTALDLGDVDGDGLVDLVVAGLVPNRLDVRTADGTGAFAGATFSSGTALVPARLDLVDKDGDGDLDVVLFGRTASELRRGAEAGRFDPPEPLALQGFTGALLGVRALDATSDGKADVLALDGSGDRVLLFEAGAGAALLPARALVDLEPAGVAGAVAFDAADLTGDGEVDVVARTPEGLRVWLQGEGGFFEAARIDGATGHALLDLDGDGALEVHAVEADVCRSAS